MSRLGFRVIVFGCLWVAGAFGSASVSNASVVPPAAEGVAHVNHVDLHYRTQGTGDAVIFVHGMLSNYQEWEPYTKALSGKFRLITYSRRHNWPNTNKFSITKDPVAVDRDDLYWLIRSQNLTKVSLVGDSYGALVTLAFAAKYPAMTDRIVLIEPMLFRWLVDEQGQQQSWGTFVDQVYVPAKRDILGGKVETATRTFLNFVLPNTVSSMAQADLDAYYHSSNDLKAALLATGGFPNVDRLDVRKVHVPTLVISGEKSPDYFDSIAREVAAITGGGPVTIVGGATHALTVDNAAAVGSDIESFLSSSSKPK